MISGTRIAAARRKLRQIRKDKPFFLKRIEEFTPEQKALAMTLFNRSLNAAQEELADLLAKHSNADQ